MFILILHSQAIELSLSLHLIFFSLSVLPSYSTCSPFFFNLPSFSPLSTPSYQKTFLLVVSPQVQIHLICATIHDLKWFYSFSTFSSSCLPLLLLPPPPLYSLSFFSSSWVASQVAPSVLRIKKIFLLSCSFLFNSGRQSLPLLPANLMCHFFLPWHPEACECLREPQKAK